MKLLYAYLPAPIHVHIERSSHGPIEIRQSHEHVRVAGPDVKPVGDQAAVLRE